MKKALSDIAQAILITAILLYLAWLLAVVVGAAGGGA